MSAGRWCFVFMFLCSAAAAQKSKSQLQKEKEKNLNKIKETERILAETTRQKANTLGELQALNRRIEVQQQLINSTKEEISILDSAIYENNEIVSSLENDLQKLKEEYAKMLYAAQKTIGKGDRLALLFSSRTFDQLAMRIKYMQQYSQARKAQERVIERVQQKLRRQVASSREKKRAKSLLLAENVEEQEKMSALQEQQKELVNVLKKQENTLRKELHETRQAVAELDVVIAKVIKEEIEKSSHELDAKDKQENKSKPKETAAFRASPEDVALSNVFAENKSRLPWPVNGFISQRFGRQPHPVLRGIMVENDGVNIQTNQDENVKAIFEGMVRAVTLNPMLGQSVLVKQGEYYVIYTCLKDVAVRQGEKISRGQLLGKVRTNSQGVAELRLMIWKNFDKLNPELWLLN